MNSDMKEMMRRSVEGFHLPRYAEIPNVGLYLEQTVRLINAYLMPLSEQGVTGTMVSNYVKSKLVGNPIKKQYYTEHIVRLIFLTIAKNVMTLEDIGLIMVLQKEQYTVQKAYDYFCDEFENCMNEAFGISQAVDGLGDTQSEIKDLVRTAIIALVHKIYMDKYIDAFNQIRQSVAADKR